MNSKFSYQSNVSGNPSEAEKSLVSCKIEQLSNRRFSRFGGHHCFRTSRNHTYNIFATTRSKQRHQGGNNVQADSTTMLC